MKKKIFLMASKFFGVGAFFLGMSGDDKQIFFFKVSHINDFQVHFISSAKLCSQKMGKFHEI